MIVMVLCIGWCLKLFYVEVGECIEIDDVDLVVCEL